MQAAQKIREALELIVCPVCFGQLSLQDSAPSAMVATVVIAACSTCGRRYPVEDGIPILLESRATLSR